MNHQEMIDVIQAHKDGKEILQQFKDDKSQPFDGNWYFHNDWIYFVKPEPKVIWVNECGIMRYTYNTEQEALDCSAESDFRTVKYIEVIDE